MKTVTISCLFICILYSIAQAAVVDKNATIIVMNFGSLNNSKITGLNLVDTEKALYDHIVESLSDIGHFHITDLPEEQLHSANINTVGMISLNDTKRIGELLNVKYIICGQLLNITADETAVKILENGLTVHAVRAQVMIVMVDTSNGHIVMAAKGEGKSESSLVKAGTAGLGTLTIGTRTVTQDSVTQSLKKAARQAVINLVAGLNGKKK